MINVPVGGRSKCYFGCKVIGTLHRLPSPKNYWQMERFRAWLKALNITAESQKQVDYIYNSVRLCNRHFETGFIAGKRLTQNAIPTLNINTADLENDHNYHRQGEPPLMTTTASNASDGSSEASQVNQKEYPGIKLDEPDDPVPAMSELENDLEIMYEDNTQDNDEYNSENDNDDDNKDDNDNDDNDNDDDVNENDDNDNDDKEAEDTSNTKYALDEVDTLFISYAASFRKLSSKLQSMLKLDLAKLFARYEMKNLILNKSCDKENPYDTKLADKNITIKKVTKGFVNQPKRIFKTPLRVKLKPKLKRPAPPPEAAGLDTSIYDVTSVEPDNTKSILGEYLKFPKTDHQNTSSETQNETRSQSINSDLDDKPTDISPTLPLYDAEKYFSDWEQVDNDDPIVEKLMLPLNWSANDVFIISEDEVPG